MFWGSPICYHYNVTCNYIQHDFLSKSNIGRAVFMNTFFWHFLVKILEVMLELILENKSKTPLFITFILYLIEKFNYMLILPDLHRFLLIVTPKTMCLL